MSASTPEFPVPTWATDDVWTSGPDVGQPTKLQPVAGLVSQGWLRGLKPPADWMNWVLNALCDWVGYTAHVPAVNWRSSYVDDAATPYDTTHVRGDGTNSAFWNADTLQWIVCGSDTAGSFYKGDDESFHKTPTGISTPPKYTFGCEAGDGNVLLFSSDLVSAGGGPPLARSASSLSTWTAGVLAGTFTTHSQAQDALLFLGAPVVVGGGDDGSDSYLAWTSADHGATWTRNVVGPKVDSLTNLARVIAGKNGRLFAWANATTLNGGNKLWYSDDGGVTWTSSGAVGFDSIVSGVYLPGHDRYVFASGTTLYITADPTTLVFTTVDTGFTITTLGGTDYWAMVGLQRAAGFYFLVMSPDLFATTRVVKREASDNMFGCVALRSDSLQQLLARSTSGVHASLRW